MLRNEKRVNNLSKDGLVRLRGVTTMKRLPVYMVSDCGDNLNGTLIDMAREAIAVIIEGE